MSNNKRVNGKTTEATRRAPTTNPFQYNMNHLSVVNPRVQQTCDEMQVDVMGRRD